MGDPSPNPNPEANQLPEAASLPDGFVESSPAEAVVDYKEEKLLEPGSRPEVVIEDGGSSLGKLVEHVADQTESTAAANAEAARGNGNAKEKCNVVCLV